MITSLNNKSLVYFLLCCCQWLIHYSSFLVSTCIVLHHTNLDIQFCLDSLQNSEVILLLKLAEIVDVKKAMNPFCHVKKEEIFCHLFCTRLEFHEACGECYWYKRHSYFWIHPNWWQVWSMERIATPMNHLFFHCLFY